MGWDLSQLSDQQLQMITAADRKPMGKAGMTSQEYQEAAKLKDEKELQGQVRQYLNLSEIEYVNPDMRKKSALPVGWPDFTLAYRGVPLGLECKVWGEKPRGEQLERHEKMRRNGWTIAVIYSLAEIQTLMREIDQQVAAKQKGISNGR